MSQERAALLVGSFWHPGELGGPIIAEHLTEAGFEVSVTEDRDVLCERALADLDLLVMWVEGITLPETPHVKGITAAHVNALADWVAAGHGLLALHSATVSFGQEAYERLVGGVFVNHPAIHTFTVRVVDGDHAVTAGVTDFAIEDELYLLKLVTEDLHLLLEADWEGAPRPLGWTRTHGAGRVCYLASGHDEPALRTPALKRLIQNAARWCAGL